jgi:hypothetical protein
MQTFDNKTDYLRELKNSRRVIFDNGKLRAEITIENPKTIHKMYSIKYFEKVEERWVSFSICVSSFLSDIIQDVKYEFKTLKID